MIVVLLHKLAQDVIGTIKDDDDAWIRFNLVQTLMQEDSSK
jgi:hypothetical protein